MISGLRIFQRSSGFIGGMTLNSRRSFVSSSDVYSQQKTGEGSTTKKPKVSPKITLIAQNNSISITSLNEAQKLAKRRDLFLVQVQEMDVKTQRPLYRLATASDMLSNELDDTAANEKTKSAQKKSEKSLTIGARISENDLSSRLKNISKWLAKGHEVRILIKGNADNAQSAEGIVKEIEKAVKEPQTIGKIVQKRNKGSLIKFTILPVMTSPNTSSMPPPTQ